MGLLSRAARAARPRTITLRDMNKGLINAAAKRGIESDIDPRLILGGGALGAMGAVPGTAHALNAIRPYEEIAQNERRLDDRAKLMNRALRIRALGYTSRDTIAQGDPDLRDALAELERQEQKQNPIRNMLEPGAQTQGLPDGAYAGQPGFYPRNSGG